MAYSQEGGTALGHVAQVHARLTPRALFPFRVESDDKLSLTGIEQLITWTYAHRLDKATTEPDIARAVLYLVQTADEWLHEEWGDRIDYSIDELRRKLRKMYGAEVLTPRPVSRAAPPGGAAAGAEAPDKGRSD